MDTPAILDAVVSHAMSLGLFEQVNTHEPDNAPGNGLTAAIWADLLGPAQNTSGLASTSAYIIFNLRIYSSMLQEPADQIDPTMLAAVDSLMNAYNGDFTLGGLVRQVDIFGQLGVQLRAQAGYVPYNDALYRAMTITIPLIINDAWEQEA